MTHFEKRWAIQGCFQAQWRYLGKHCWDDAMPDEPTIRTFRTRDLARQAKRLLTSYGSESRVVAVRVIVCEAASAAGEQNDKP